MGRITFAIKIAVPLAVASVYICSISAQSSHVEKKWDFKGKGGIVEIEFTRYIQDNEAKATSLSIYSPDGEIRSVPEEGRFLSSVLDDLSKGGIAPTEINWVSFRLNEPDAIAQVASCAASSSKWRPALRTRSIRIVYDLVTEFLNNCGAYQDWENVFQQRGITMRVAGVEEVIMQPFSKTQARCPRGSDCAHLIVPTDALVQMNIYPVSSK